METLAREWVPRDIGCQALGAVIENLHVALDQTISPHNRVTRVAVTPFRSERCVIVHHKDHPYWKKVKANG